MKKVIGYLRVSTAEQGDSGLGLESQESKIRAYCKLYDLDVVEVIIDTASGKNLNRTGLQKALSSLSSGVADGLVIAKLDRLTRSVRDMGSLLEGYFESRHELHVVSDQINTSTAAGRMVLNILVSVSQWERETIVERTRDALAAKRQRGEKTGGKETPFGYDATADGKLIPNPDEQTIIRMMHRLRAKGYSYQRISDTLNADGYLTKTGRYWKWHIVRKIAMREAA